ncbi:hypothetical protein BDB00DRAFT_570855 [Zychaea mexicana]|uniref:uncharacterized protein n=1 Tax=Zychaea mexicana TaxID=64656 RepID=UPI0022FEABA3|nr:uncharacterized protein BDB00DRAFT_570855 [Zychaea mexicana]KAI9490004.1 hypothetical protein BDB00DRAFT_570855 [Zychaea mexicana]
MNRQHHLEKEQQDENNDEQVDPPPLPIQFQLLYNWEASAEHDALLKNKIRMFPTFKCDWHGTSVYRIMDHDLGHHCISAVDFLLPHFPFCDVWVSVEKARHMVSILGVEAELQNLLTHQLDEAFSTDNLARNELVHNWKIESIPNVVYSTRALLETPVLDDVSILVGSRKIRTQISRIRQPGMVCKDRLENGLVRWAVYAYEAFHHQQQQQQEQEGEGFYNDDSVQTDKYGKSVANAMWDVMQGLLYDLQTLALGGSGSNNNDNNNNATTARVLSDNMVVGNMPLKREYLAQGASLQNVYLASMVEKIHHETQALGLLSASLIHHTQRRRNKHDHHRASSMTLANNNSNNSTSDYHTSIPAAAAPTATTTTTTGGGTTGVSVDPHMMLHDRMDSLEQEIYRMKRKYKRRTDDMQSEFQELQQQILALEAWKIRSERARRSERIWILMISLSLFVGFWTIRAVTAAAAAAV